MNSYPIRSSMKRKRRSRKWVYFIVSSLLIIFMIKNFIHRSEPVSVFGGADELNLSIAGAEIENSAMLSAPEPIPEQNLCQIPDLLSESSPELTTIIDDVIACIEAKPPRIIDARDKLNKTLSMPMSRQQLAFVKEQLSKLSKEWLFSRAVFPEDNLCSSYKVRQGELLATIGKQHNVPYEILMQINNISNPKALRAAEMIKVIKGPFHARIYRSTFTMDLYLQDTYVRSFSVGLGKPGMETPTGRWRVEPSRKLIKPTWTDHTGKTFEAEDPDYPLGSRWIGLEGIEGQAEGRVGFAIHGTKNPEEIGRAVSRGCIRLYDGDVILLYNLLTPGVSQVIVVE